MRLVLSAILALFGLVFASASVQAHPNLICIDNVWDNRYYVKLRFKIKGNAVRYAHHSDHTTSANKGYETIGQGVTVCYDAADLLDGLQNVTYLIDVSGGRDCGDWKVPATGPRWSGTVDKKIVLKAGRFNCKDQ